MKVRCKKLLDASATREVTDSSWLTIGKEYVVLEVVAEVGRAPMVRIVSDDGVTPIVASILQFVVLDSQMPKSWEVSVNEHRLCVGPGPWMKPGFWEEYFDGSGPARHAYQEELGKIFER